mmetsp:Transcript_110470/g.174041  ORF Transcript_110470/g.174041 Transcript_110470/m.174041 type:complete len:93 (+) Transcript_110470:29-307(+)
MDKVKEPCDFKKQKPCALCHTVRRRIKDLRNGDDPARASQELSSCKSRNTHATVSSRRRMSKNGWMTAPTLRNGRPNAHYSWGGNPLSRLAR